MAVQTEPARLGDLVKWEQDANYSREKVTVASGNNLVLGEVVGRVTATGKIAAFDQDAIDGTEAACGVMVEACDASTADTKSAAMVRDSFVMASQLTWPADIIAGEITTALAELKALGIVAREEA